MDQLDRKTADTLATEIMSLARANRHRELLALADDHTTWELLEHVSDAERRQASVHLEAAQRWRVRKNQKAGEKLDAVEKAVSEFDVVLARGLLRKIDWKLLDEETLVRYNTLSLDVTALAIDVEDLERRIPAPEPDAKPERRFWRRS